MGRILRSSDFAADLEEAAYYIGVTRQSPHGADRLIDAVEEACRRYAQHPLMGQARPELGENVRCFSCGAPSNPRGFVVLYRPSDDGIELIRLFRASRDYPNLLR